MGKPMILVSSITYAMKSRDILSHDGIKAYVERTPRGGENAGCSYSLYVPERTDEAEAILMRAEVPMLGRAERSSKA